MLTLVVVVVVVVVVAVVFLGTLTAGLSACWRL